MEVKASVNYHVQKDEPQAFLFDVDGIAGNLYSPELTSTNVNVQDIRELSKSVNFDTDGITFEYAPSSVNDFNEGANWQSQYDNEIKSLLKSRIGANEVIVFDHTVRIDDVQAERKPARNVHNDYSEAGALQRLIDLVGEDTANEYRNGRFGFVNVWRPIANMIIHSPLGFIHPDSVSASDWMDIELIYPDRKGQILGVAANPAHRWFYLSNMTPEEVVIFNIYDNQNRPFLAHSALDITNQQQPTFPRQSIESRTLIRFE